MQDDDILQDYLTESRELLEQAQGDALQLEKDPQDDEVLAALFRAFHTIKGGAGFVGADHLVEWTHHLEDLLDKLRSHSLTVTDATIDAILKGLDIIEAMFEELEQGDKPQPGPDDLGEQIKNLANGIMPPDKSEENDEKDLLHDSDDAVDREFEDLLSAVQDPQPEQKTDPSPQSSSQSSSTSESDEITEEEFEALLDALQGTANHQNDPKSQGEIADNQATKKVDPPAPTPNHEEKKTKPQTSNSGNKISRSSHNSATEKTLRVDAERMDAILNQIGEIVLLRNRFNSAIASLGQENEILEKIAREMDLAVNDMQTTTMQLRMQPCKRLFQSLPRVVRDASKKLSKEVELVIQGEDVEIDKSVIDALSAPMTHLVRNSLDHGIEPPKERRAAGKSTKATLKVAAIHLGDRVRIEVSDDGRGIDRHVIVAKAIEKGVISSEEAAHLNDAESLELIFKPGFSTKDQASDLSGRGVGMDVVKETVRELRGKLDIQTRPGQGTKIAMEFPLTLAILSVLYLRIRRDIYAMPISVIESLIDVTPNRIHSLKNRTVYQINEDDVVPLINMGDVLYGNPLGLGTEPIEGVLTEKGLFMVSEVLGNEDAVVKPMDFISEDKNSNWYQGATISGKGEVVLILDPNTLVALGVERMGSNA